MSLVLISEIRPPRLLIVDDSEANRDMLAQRLQRAGMDVRAAAGGTEALEAVAHQPPDLILLDIRMPGMSGIDVLVELRRQWSPARLPVVMVTGQDDANELVAALDLGANDYVTKPVQFKPLLARIRTQLRLKSLSDLRDQFLQIASHDLRNPLARIMGFASILLDSMPPGEPMGPDSRRHLGQIMAGAEQMNSIIGGFLELGRDRKGSLVPDLEPVATRPLLEAVVSAHAVLADAKSIPLTFVVDDGADSILADAKLIRQVLDNLVSNAIKFSFQGAPVLVRARREGSSVRIEVRDSGPGFTPDDLERAFGEYTRLSGKPTGSESSYGLGLSLARRMASLQGGTVGITNNTEGSGATAWFQSRLRGAS